MRLHLTTVCLLLLLALISTVTAQEKTPTIVDHITAGTSNTVTQPESLLKRLYTIQETIVDDEDREEEVGRPVNGRMAGYRVQVFSDNNVRTAKAEAASKQRVISARFPQYQTYVRYTSPYWRLKVGDFRTMQEANNAADELRKAFPQFSKEIRVVRDRISLNGE